MTALLSSTTTPLHHYEGLNWTLTFETTSPRSALLVLDGMESSFIDLDDPGHLEFEYMQQMDAALSVVRHPGPVRALHLGGAGCALARAWAHTRPGSRQLVVEWDAVLAELAREYCDIPRSPDVRIRVAEARAALQGFPEGRWDVIVRDTFAGGAVPAHMRTYEVGLSAHHALSEAGLYLVNLTDRPPLAMARSEVATISSIFEHVAVAIDPSILRGRRYGNALIIASKVPFDEAALARACRALPLPVTVLVGSKLAEFAGTMPVLHDELN
ncbi:hypothetical protein BSZ39_00415 [Bowdeniella nasicola]|uniref:Spermidine synthase n=1 Tax=Bowdeniella nasicola TaxID=208480 RepID=A0A1Q5Q680_9ACTO|nr:fused MFS/spermidine synthase [Bowdeniella nasicola]OKL55199.1 hypothetical protein BSZ39_00415 [Bowdeniella nasicola]